PDRWASRHHAGGLWAFDWVFDMLVYFLSWRVASKRWFWVLSLASKQRFARLGPVADDRGLHWFVYGHSERIGASEAGNHIASSRFAARCRQRHLLALVRRSAPLCLGAVRSPPDTSRSLSSVSESVLA